MYLSRYMRLFLLLTSYFHSLLQHSFFSPSFHAQAQAQDLPPLSDDEQEMYNNIFKWLGLRHNTDMGSSSGVGDADEPHARGKRLTMSTRSLALHRASLVWQLDSSTAQSMHMSTKQVISGLMPTDSKARWVIRHQVSDNQKQDLCTLKENTHSLPMSEDVKQYRCSLENCDARLSSGWALIDHLCDAHCIIYSLKLLFPQDQRSLVCVRRICGILDCPVKDCFKTQSIEGLYKHLKKDHANMFTVLDCDIDQGLSEHDTRMAWVLSTGKVSFSDVHEPTNSTPVLCIPPAKASASCSPKQPPKAQPVMVQTTMDSAPRPAAQDGGLSPASSVTPCLKPLMLDLPPTSPEPSAELQCSDQQSALSMSAGLQGPLEPSSHERAPSMNRRRLEAGIYKHHSEIWTQYCHG
ncbi:hypothetical protein GGX14DRAFT_388895 [Mycena pura]|uniref:C2H2-type domain-containing protein n=1 Tax=Mycena pura TaxID=153505 RepID=A0AAD6VU48_9AGAR|nr:hypothetical protein GGX14DRAFT_388895 [Mycena pura]